MKKYLIYIPAVLAGVLFSILWDLFVTEEPITIWSILHSTLSMFVVVVLVIWFGNKNKNKK